MFLLPGILGSNLAINGKRIWLGARLINGLKRLAYPDQEGFPVEPDGPIGMTYDELRDFLSRSHEVIEFAFDWRKPIEKEAERLGAEIDAQLDLRMPAASRCGSSRTPWAGCWPGAGTGEARRRGRA